MITALSTKYSVAAAPIKMEKSILPVPGSMYKSGKFILVPF
jgi:hypothetical protein